MMYLDIAYKIIEAEAEGLSVNDIITTLLNEVQVP